MLVTALQQGNIWMISLSFETKHSDSYVSVLFFTRNSWV